MQGRGGDGSGQRLTVSGCLFWSLYVSVQLEHCNSGAVSRAEPSSRGWPESSPRVPRHARPSQAARLVGQFSPRRFEPVEAPSPSPRPARGGPQQTWPYRFAWQKYSLVVYD